MGDIEDRIIKLLAKNNLTIEDYEKRVLIDGEVFIGTDGFVDPENIVDIPIDQFTYWMNKQDFEFDSEEQKQEFLKYYKLPTAPTAEELKKFSRAALRGAEAGRKLANAMNNSNDAIYKLGVAINMSIPHNPGKIKRFFRWILAKIRGDIPTSYTDSMGNIYRGWAKIDDGRRWWKPWTWSMWSWLKNIGKGVRFQVLTRFGDLRGGKNGSNN